VAPLTVGLMLASCYFLARSANDSLAADALTGATVVALVVTRINPLWLIVAGALIGLAGLV